MLFHVEKGKNLMLTRLIPVATHWSGVYRNKAFWSESETVGLVLPSTNL